MKSTIVKSLCGDGIVRDRCRINCTTPTCDGEIQASVPKSVNFSWALLISIRLQVVIMLRYDVISIRGGGSWRYKKHRKE